MKHFTFVKAKFSLLLLLLSGTIFSQTNVYFGQKDLTYPQKGGIYETAEDLKNDNLKDVGKFEYFSDIIVLGKTRIGVKFEKEFFPLKKATIFGFKDDLGNRFRIVDGNAYIVLSAGSKWLYSSWYSGNGYSNRKFEDKKMKNKIEKYGAYREIVIWYSNGGNSELKEIKKWDKTPSKEANEKLFMDDAEISQQYMSDVSEEYDPNYKNGCMDHLERIIHYLDLYNKKHPKEK